MLYELRGNSEQAIERYESAIRIDPNLAEAKNNLAYILADRGTNLDRALDLAQEAKAQLPESANAADTLGWVLLKKGIPEAALGYLREAESGFPPNHPDLGWVRYHLAMAYEANQQPAQAREVLQRALDSQAAAEQAARERGVTGELPTPPWVPDVRAMLDRLPATPPAG